MKELTNLLEQLAVKLGTTVENLWGVLIKQATITGISYIFGIVVFGIFVYFNFKFCKKRWSEMKKDSWWNWGLVDFFEFIIWVFIVIFIIAITFNIDIIFAAFLNPEYWALKEILSAIR